MKIIYYKSVVCPRCIPTGRFVAQLRQAYPEIEVEEVEVLTNLPRMLRDGVLMLPTIIAGPNRFHHTPRMEELLTALEADSSPALSEAA